MLLPQLSWVGGVIGMQHQVQLDFNISTADFSSRSWYISELIRRMIYWNNASPFSIHTLLSEGNCVDPFFGSLWNNEQWQILPSVVRDCHYYRIDEKWHSGGQVCTVWNLTTNLLLNQDLNLGLVITILLLYQHTRNDFIKVKQTRNEFLVMSGFKNVFIFGKC